MDTMVTDMDILNPITTIIITAIPIIIIIPVITITITDQVVTVDKLTSIVSNK